MIDLASDAEGVLVRQFLLAHLDPVAAVAVVDRAGEHRTASAASNVVFFGMDVDPALHRLLRRMLAGGVAPPFAELAVTVIEQARLSVVVTGLVAIREMDDEIVVAPPEDADPAGIAGRIVAADALCDLLIQPVRAFCDMFYGLAADPLQLVAMPDVAPRVFYRTNRPSLFETRLEILIRDELGLPVEQMDDEGSILNIP